MRVKSLKELGRGGWRVSSSTPFRPPIKKASPQKGGESIPHRLLWNSVLARWPGAKKEFAEAVPGRRFRIDIAFPDIKLAIEVDGWQWHGKHKNDFKKDRERQNLLTLHGWRILRFTAGDIYQSTEACVKTVEKAIGSES